MEQDNLAIMLVYIQIFDNTDLTFVFVAWYAHTDSVIWSFFDGHL